MTSVDSNQWNLRKLITFASVKLYCLITLIFLIILISHIGQLLLIRKIYFFYPGPHISFNMRNIIIYVARWWEKYLSKHSLIKYTCSWRDKLRNTKKTSKKILRMTFNFFTEIQSILESFDPRVVTPIFDHVLPSPNILQSTFTFVWTCINMQKLRLFHYIFLEI